MLTTRSRQRVWDNLIQWTFSESTIRATAGHYLGTDVH
jgi:hypothetical protein